MGMGASLADKVLEKLFPGLSTETLRKGSIPIPQFALTTAMKRYLVRERVVKDISVHCQKGKVIIEVDTEKYVLLKHRFKAMFTIQDFVISKEKQHATVRINNPVEPTGRNLISKILVFFFCPQCFGSAYQHG